MSQKPDIGSLVGRWSYRSFLNDPDLATPFGDLKFGAGTIELRGAPMGVLAGTIGDTGWSLELSGSVHYGDPYCVRFRGKGVVGGEEWVYDYVGYVIAPWPNGVEQVPAMVGTIVRAIPHSGASPGAVAPAGVVCSWIAVWQGEG